MRRSLALVAAGLSAAVLAISAQSAAAVGVTDVFKRGYEAYSKYNACMKNIDAGQPCLASDSANIRQILKDVKALRAEIQANQKAVEAQVNRLQATLDNKVRNDLVTLLNPVTLNMSSALAAYQGLSTCASNRAAGKATCPGIGGKTEVAVTKGIADHQAVLLQKVGLMSDDIRSTTAVYTGTALGGDNSGLLAADWDMHKHVQENDAGVTDTATLSALTVPVLTPSLANATTKFATTYDDYLESYGMLKPFVAGLKGQDAVAEDMQADVLDVVYGTNPFSVASRTAQFTLPHLQPSEIAFVRETQKGKQALIVSPYPTAGNRAGARILTPETMFDLGRAVDAYGTYSVFQEKRPAAFPANGWYPVQVRTHYVEVCPRTGTWCPSANDEFWVHQLARSTDPKTTRAITVRMKLTNAKPTWDTKYEKTAYGTNGVNFKKEFEHFIKGPAVFDWAVATYSPRNIGVYYKVGPGAWVTKWTVPVGAAILLPSVPAMMG